MVKLADSLGIPELTTNQVEASCTNAEDAPRKYFFSKVSLKMIEKLNISVEAEDIKPLKVTVEVNLSVMDLGKTVDLKKIADEANVTALKVSEEYLGNLR